MSDVELLTAPGLARRWGVEAFRVPHIPRVVAAGWPLALIVGVAAFLRFWHINALGYNSDEAVYAGQGASIANDPQLTPFFPVFRAHPLLFQSLLSIGYHFGAGDLFGRSLAAIFGIATVLLVYEIGRLLYGHRTGLVSAALLAVMPYHVVTSRQVLLDVPMVFFATLTLYLLARYALGGRPIWLYAAAGSMGLTFLSKETSILLMGAGYAFFALRPEIRVRIRRFAIALAITALVVSPYPLSLHFAGHSNTGQNYLAWQLFRRPNHDWKFYGEVVPPAIGFAVVVLALAGLWLLRREKSWRETLLVSWIVVPVAFFELWPVKGFQYLLPIAPAFALLAGRTLARWPDTVGRLRRRWVVPVAAALVSLSLVVPSWQRIEPSSSGTFLAGSGGVPGGREVGTWLDAHVPKGAVLLAVGPSMANIMEFYGHRKAYGLSVSPNPLHRNPAYEPVVNPDLLLRRNEAQYIVWDAFSANRTPFFSNKLKSYVDRYHGVAVHTESISVRTNDGKLARRPVIIIYEVHP
jgi:hypothetical protein